MHLLALPLMLVFGLVNAQDEKPVQKSEDELFRVDTPVTVELEKENSEPVSARKKREKRNTFYGIKTKKGFTKTGFGDNMTLELFYYIKGPVKVDPYVKEIYWFDFRRKAIRNTPNIDFNYGVVLHGPYKKTIGKQVIEEGFFYKGAKHGTWTQYDKNDILVDKRKYHKGWYKESLVSYYDPEHTKLKEVIPIQYGKKEGEYYYFHENGNIAVTGHYENDQKVGTWTEYYDVRGRRKKLVQYREDPYDKDFQPYIVKEWNDKAQLVYDRTTSGR